jgi:CHAT domain-containing protein
VVIVADGPLHALNFETLPLPGDPPRLWIEEATLSRAPSLGLLLDPSPQSRTGRSLLLIGDPLAAGPEFPALTRAAAEIDAIHKHFHRAKIYRGPGATPHAFRQAPPEPFSHIHFTSHAVANADSPLDSFIQLSPYQSRSRLFARDIARLHLTAELVTISACRGAGSRAYSGEGLVGLGWAFLRAGASSVIAGLWDVPDDATALLMDSLYDGLQSGASPAEALTRAKRKLLLEEDRYRKPFYWGSLQVYVRSPRGR